jgi:hypothetical protein
MAFLCVYVSNDRSSPKVSRKGNKNPSRQTKLIADCTEGNKEEGDAHPVEDPATSLATSLGLELTLVANT